jgi:hypothetical protein
VQDEIKVVRKFQGVENDEELVRLVVDKLIVTAQGLLEADKVLVPIAAMLCEDSSTLLALSHADPEAKQRAYAKLRTYAKLKKAHAVIAIGDGTIELTNEEKSDAILVLVRAKSKSYSIVIPYYRHSVADDQEMILFMEPYDWTGGEMQILRGWW